REVSLLAAAQGPMAFEYPDIPWQISRHALANLPPGARAFVSGRGACVVASTTLEPARLHILDPGVDDARGWSDLLETVAAALRAFPHRDWSAPAVFPEAWGSRLFEPLGFRREALNQFLMRTPVVS